MDKRSPRVTLDYGHQLFIPVDTDSQATMIVLREKSFLIYLFIWIKN